METAVVSSLVNFLLVVGTLAYFGRKPLFTFMASRSDAIAESIATAEKLSHESQRVFDHWSSRMNQSSAEAEGVRKDAANLIAGEQRNALTRARSEIERIEHETRVMMGVEELRAKKALESEIAEASIELAKDYLRENVTGEVASGLFADALEKIRVSDGRGR